MTQDLDRPRAIVALFASEEAGIAALDRLHDAGFPDAWLGVTHALKDGTAFSSVVRERGGGTVERFVRFFFSGNGGEPLSSVMHDHGVADDVARALDAKMPEDGVVVIAGWRGDIRHAATVLEAAGGTLVRGDDGGTIGTPRERAPGPDYD